MITLTDAEREALRVSLAKWSKSEGRVGAILSRDIAPAVEQIVTDRLLAAAEAIEAEATRGDGFHTDSWAWGGRSGMAAAARIVRDLATGAGDDR